MGETYEENKNTVIQEVRKKVTTLNIIVTVVIFSLFFVLVRYALPNLVPFVKYIPEISISIIVSIVFFLAVLGLYLSIRLSRETVRIMSDYSVRLERMLNITRDLREEIYGDILLEKIMDYSLDITRSEAGSLLLINDNLDLEFKIVRGERASQLLGTTVPIGKGVSGWVAREGKPVRCNNVKDEKHFSPEVDALTGYETKSILCVPLKTRDGVIGVLELLNKTGGFPYRQRDEEIISYLAAQAAISILKTKFAEDQKNYEIHLTDMLLETIDFQQPEKRGHARRVARYSNIIAKSLDLPEDVKKQLYMASLLHDVGFLRINLDEAYNKEVYMQHPVIGYEMIKPITFYAGIAPFILYHHLRYDGYGYPSADLKGEEIPLEARIIAIAEAFDAMTSPLSYKVPMSIDAAVEELREKSGSQFDTRLVDAFVAEITTEQIK
ncbi:MAG: HD domain-containing protein [Nitrospirae bacterium]|nr:HD domain-containing protein [Nitrospirota bacterium]